MLLKTLVSPLLWYIWCLFLSLHSQTWQSDLHLWATYTTLHWNTQPVYIAIKQSASLCSQKPLNCFAVRPPAWKIHNLLWQEGPEIWQFKKTQLFFCSGQIRKNEPFLCLILANTAHPKTVGSKPCLNLLFCVYN